MKNGTTLTQRLLDFRTADKGFAHVLGGQTDAVATQQAFYALVAAQRAEQGLPTLFSMA